EGPGRLAGHSLCGGAAGGEGKGGGGRGAPGTVGVDRGARRRFPGRGAGADPVGGPLRRPGGCPATLPGLVRDGRPPGGWGDRPLEYRGRVLGRAAGRGPLPVAVVSGGWLPAIPGVAAAASGPPRRGPGLPAPGAPGCRWAPSWVR